MKYRILITTSGGGNAQNIIRSLRKSSVDCYIVGVNADKFEMAKSNADINYLVQKFDHPLYIDSMCNIIEKEKIDFIILNHEVEIKTVIDSKCNKILSKCFLPKKEVVDLCINKFELINFLERKGIKNIPKSYILNETNNIKSLSFPLWIRLKKGAGSQGATLIHNIKELDFWIEYWIKYKGVRREDFMISEYLPNNDYHYFSLWKNGEMVVGKSIQRLRYCCSKYTLTGTSSSPSLCKVVSNADLDEISQKIVSSIDLKAQGLYGIDYKGNINGVNCLTEINIGRFPRINYIFNLGSSPNIAELYVKCGLGISFPPQKVILPDEELYLIRDFDTTPVLKSISQINAYKTI